MVALGYGFHFTARGSWIVTPDLEILDIVEKGGLYWLKWAKAVNPLSAEYVSQAAKQGASQGVCCALLEPTAQERAEVDPWDAVFAAGARREEEGNWTDVFNTALSTCDRTLG